MTTSRFRTASPYSQLAALLADHHRPECPEVWPSAESIVFRMECLDSEDDRLMILNRIRGSLGLPEVDPIHNPNEDPDR